MRIGLLGQDAGTGVWAWLGRAKATTPKATATVRIERFTEVSRDAVVRRLTMRVSSTSGR